MSESVSQEDSLPEDDSEGEQLRDHLRRALAEGRQYASCLPDDDPLRRTLLEQRFDRRHFGDALEAAQEADRRGDKLRAASAWSVAVLTFVWHGQTLEVARENSSTVELPLGPGVSAVMQLGEWMLVMVVSAARSQSRIARWPLARELLRLAATEYQYQVNQAEKAHLAAPFAEVLNSLGTASAFLGDQGEAVDAFQAAVTIRRRIALERGEILAPKNLANSLRNLGKALSDAQRDSEARQAYLEALTLLRGLVAGTGLEELAGDLSNVLANLADVQARINALDEAIASYEEAIDFCRSRLHHEGSEEVLSDLAWMLNNFGLTLMRQHRSDDAARAYQEACAALRHLVVDAGHEQLINHWARVLVNLGVAVAEKEPARAIEAYGNAVALRRKLVQGPAQSDVENELAGSLNTLGQQLAQHGRLTEAIAAYEESLTIRRRLVYEDGDASIAVHLAGVLWHLAEAFVEQNELHRAVDTYSEAAEIYRHLFHNFQKNEIATDFDNLLGKLNLILLTQGRNDEALVVCKECIALQRHLQEGQDTDWGQERLAVSLQLLGKLLTSQDPPGEALTAFEESASIFRRLVAVRPEGHLIERLSSVLVCCGNIFREQRRFDAATATLSEAVAALRPLLIEGSEPDLMSQFAGSLCELGMTLTLQQRLSEAEAAIAESIAILRRQVQNGVPAAHGLAHALGRLGNVLARRQKVDAACQAYDEAEAICHRLLEDAGQTSELERSAIERTLASDLHNVGLVLCQQQHLRKAEERFRESLAIWRGLAEESDSAADFDQIATVLNGLGNAFADQERWDDALQAHEEAILIWQRLVRDGGDRYLEGLPRALNNLGLTLASHQRTADALKAYSDACVALAGMHDPAWDTPQQCVRVSRNILNAWRADPSWSPAALLPMFNQLTTAMEVALEFRSVSELGRSEAGVGRATDFFNDFFALWLLIFIREDRWLDAAEVVTRAHGRRLQALQLARLQARRNDDDLSERQRDFLRRLAEFHELERRHAATHRPNGGSGSTAEGTIPIRTEVDYGNCGSTTFGRSDDARSELLSSLRDLRNALVDAGELPDVNQWRRSLEDQVEALGPGQALGIVVLPLEFGVELGGALVVLNRAGHGRASLESLPRLQKLADTLTAEFEGRSHVRHSAQSPQPKIDDLPGQRLLELSEEIVKSLREAVWRPLDDFFTEHGIIELTLLPQGQAHVLPWQASAPRGLDVRVHVGPNSKGASANVVTLPTVDTPLYLLANDASADSSPLRRLWYVPLEIQAIQWLHAKHGSGAVSRLTHPRRLERRAQIWAMGHGHDAPDGRTGQAVLACGSVPDQITVSPHAFVEHGHPVTALVASACLVGRVTELDHEPMGLPTVLALADVGLVAGSLLAIDDLYAALLSIAVHSHWLHDAREGKHDGDLRKAINQARRSLACAAWPNHLTIDFEELGRALLPSLLTDVCETTLSHYARFEGQRGRERQELARAIARQIAMLQNDWGLCEEGNKCGVEALHKQLIAGSDQVAAQAVLHFVRNLDSLSGRARAVLTSQFFVVFG